MWGTASVCQASARDVILSYSLLRHTRFSQVPRFPRFPRFSHVTVGSEFLSAVQYVSCLLNYNDMSGCASVGHSMQSTVAKDAQNGLESYSYMPPQRQSLPWQGSVGCCRSRLCKQLCQPS
jgi:hypothetical protein